MKVSEKGGLSIYGLGRFPVTLYKEQWEKLLDLSEEIKTFIVENKEKLKTTGSTTVKMTDFGIQPPTPKFAGGLIKTGDDVKITFEWLTALPAKSADASQK